MRLNDFFDKPKVRKSTEKKVISLSNETKERGLEQEISFLKEKLNEMEKIKEENSRLENAWRAKEDDLQNIYSENSKLIQENSVLKVKVEDLSPVRDENTSLKNSLKEAESTITNQKSSLELAQKSNIEVQLTISDSREKINTLEIENKNLQNLNTTYREERDQSQNQLNKLEKMIEDFDEKFKSIRVKYNEIEKDNKDLLMGYKYWKNVAESLEEERENLQDTKFRLQEMYETITSENDDQKGINKVKQTEIQKLQNKVNGLTGQIASLLEDNRYLVGLSADLKKELAKPRFMSVAAIERSEGFKMPMGGTRTHFLGQGKPTLLKFKTGGSTNDN